MARGQDASRKKKADTGAHAEWGKAELIEAYRSMLLIRRFEERAGQLYGMGLIGGFCHLYIGQEAIAVGVQSVKEPGDQVITGYRDHGHMLACGMDPREVMAELTGRSGGSSKGKGGSMHMFSTEADFYGGHGIVGAQVSLGTGLAFANRYRQNGKVAFVYFGDGAANQGQVYESFNMAELWSLPAVYIIENNQYAMGTSIERSSSETHLYKRGASFRIPGEEVDGMDVGAVRAAATRAAEHARSGEGPYILEMKTYRYRGHSMSDPAKYRTREEVDEVRKTRDPIDHLQERLIAEGFADEAALKAIDAEVKKVVADAAEFARTSPEPAPDELHTDVYLEAAQ
ncbi:MAG: pyruvate dehydrogenase (acetyl-transferring) E1 component subunit alpha [Phenylobacterium sp.]|uniref:pyruvate dehydrogenase (acetyl-transferring) E1 component subunit alpha n=1 Tax=Phenylobacterium sp. TaxID=1871053 RepID=UPI00391BFFA0